MGLLAIIGLSLLGVIIIIGIIRLIVKPVNGFWDFFLHLFLIDILFDVLGAILGGLGDIDLDL